MPISFEYPGKCLFELLIGKGIAERVHGTVGIAEEIGKHVQVLVGAGRVPAKALDQGQHMIGRPTGHKTAQDKRNGAKGLACPILRFGFLSTHSNDQGYGGLFTFEMFANRLHEIPFAGAATTAGGGML